MIRVAPDSRVSTCSYRRLLHFRDASLHGRHTRYTICRTKQVRRPPPPTTPVQARPLSDGTFGSREAHEVKEQKLQTREGLAFRRAVRSVVITGRIEARRGEQAQLTPQLRVELGRWIVEHVTRVRGKSVRVAPRLHRELVHVQLVVRVPVFRTVGGR